MLLCYATRGRDRRGRRRREKQGDRQPASGYPYRTDTQTTAAAPRAEEQKRGGLQSHDKTQADVIIDGDVQFPRIFVLLFCSILSSHPISPPPSPSIAHDNTTEPMQRNATGYYCTYMYVLHACMHACMDLHIRPHTNLFSTSLLGRLCGRRDRSVDLRIQPQMHAWPARAAAAAAATLLQGLSSDCPDREEARPADRGAACSAGTPLNVF